MKFFCFYTEDCREKLSSKLLKNKLISNMFETISTIQNTMHLIFAIVQFEISSLMSWIFLPAVAFEIQV